MSATTMLSLVSNKEKKMKCKNRGQEELTRDTNRRDTNRKMIKRCKTRTNRRGSDEEEKEGRWSELPYEILDIIVKRIYFIDLINLRAVCKAWHYPFNSSQTLKQIPWLIIFENNSCKLIDPAYKRTYIVNDPKIEEKKFYDMEVHDSKCGWILMSSQSCQTSGTFFFLYTPFLTENNVIELPVLNSKFHLATFSCAPSVGTTQHDYVLLAFSNSDSGEVSISICRRGDHTWRTQHHESYFPLSKIRSVVYSLGVFYCPSSSGSIGIFNVDRDEWVVLEQKQPQSEMMMACLNHNRNTHAFLLKSDVDGEFLLVLTWVLRKKWSCPKLVVFRLYRSEMIWQTLDNLDDRAWFIMRGSSVAMELPKWKGVVFFCLFEYEREVMYSKLRSLGSGCFGKGYFCSGWHNRLYPCTKLYGSFGGQLQKQIWLDPSW